MNTKNLYDSIKAVETQFGSVERVNRSDYVSIALGTIAASVSALPTSPLSAPTNHFILQHEGNIKRVFSSINESYIFNIPLAMKVARQVYLARYRRVFDPSLILSELTLLMPDSVSKMPEEVTKVFADLSDSQKEMFANTLIPDLSAALGNQS